jgi:hypothetical protein
MSTARWSEIAEDWGAPRVAHSSKASVPIYDKHLFPWSSEQLTAIVNPARPLLIEAFAGAGKTSVLLEFARRDPGKKWLYLAYNKALADSAGAEAKMLGAKTQTLHALAFSYYGKSLGKKLGREWTKEELRWALGADGDNNENSHPQKILSGLEYFANSADEALSIKHAPSGTNDPETWLFFAQRAWGAMIDPDQPLGAPHEVYLKLFLLDKRKWPAGGLLIDEAQDLTPALQSAILTQGQGMPVIAAGDRHQNIYEFRGASAGLWEQGHERTVLHESRRFGEKIGGVVQVILERMGETRKIEGAGGGGDAYESEEIPAGAVALAPMHHELRGIASDLGRAGRGCWASGAMAAELGVAAAASSDGDVRLSTVHGVKGETLDKVWLAPGMAKGVLGDNDQGARLRLLYVAASRARSLLTWHPAALERNVDRAKVQTDCAEKTSDSWID